MAACRELNSSVTSPLLDMAGDGAADPVLAFKSTTYFRSMDEAQADSLP
jgi:hypothetical protein